MGNSDTPNTAPGVPPPEKPKPEQKELLPSEDEEKEDTPEMDLPGTGISSEPPEEPAQEEPQTEEAPSSEKQAEEQPQEHQGEEQESPVLGTPAEDAEEDILEEAATEGPKPPDLTPPTPPPPSADQAAPDAQKEEEPYEVPPALGDFLGNQLKDLGLGGQISMGGSAFCLLSSFFWDWPDVKGGPEWFAILAMLLLSIEAITLVCLHMPDKLAQYRGRLKDLLFVATGHIVVLSLLALLLQARIGPVLSLIGGLVVLAGTYIWLVKSRPAAA